MEKLINNIENIGGNSGTSWLNTLPNKIDKLSKKWSLTHVLPFSNLTFGFVAAATQNTKPVVIKIAFDDIFMESEFLKYNNGNGMVKILDVDIEQNALLLEKITPGITLKDFPTSLFHSKIKIYANIVNTIASVPSNNNSVFPSIESWCEALTKIDTTIVNKKISEKALQVVDYLLKTSKNIYLCHGDLHLENILQDNDKWIAIDPKGVIAEKEFEVTGFPLLSDDELFKKVNLAKRIMSRNHSLALQFQFNPQRLLAWFFIKYMLSIQWHIEDNTNYNKSLLIAEQIFSLLKLDI